MKNLTFYVKLSEAEFLKFSLQHFYRSLLGKIITVFGLFLLAAPTLMFLIKPEFVNGKFPLPQFILGLVFIVVVPLLIFRASKKAYFGNSQLSEKTQYIFDDEGVNLKADTYSIQLKWTRIIQVAETNDFFLLYVTTQSSHIIPKAQLKEIEISSFRNTIISILNLKHSLFE